MACVGTPTLHHRGTKSWAICVNSGGSCMGGREHSPRGVAEGPQRVATWALQPGGFGGQGRVGGAGVGVVTALTHLEPTRSSDQTKSSCPRVKGRARSRVTWGSEAPRLVGGGGDRSGDGEGNCHLPAPAAPRGARTRAPARARAQEAQGAASGGRCWERGAAPRSPGPGDRVRGSGPSHLGSRPAPYPTLPADLGRAHAPELLSRGVDGPAQAPPLAVGAAEPVVHVELDKDDLCGAGCWGRASPPPGPAPPELPPPHGREPPLWEPCLPGPGGTPCRLRVKGTLRLAWARVSSLA